MDKREPSLVPEWLRSSGHSSSGGSSNHLLSSSSHSDSSSLSHNSNNKNSRSKSDAGSVRSPFLNRSSSTNTRRGTSNGSTKHAYSNFNVNRNNRDKDRSREKDRLSYMDPWDQDPSFPYGTFLIGRDQEQLRRSHSMTTRKQDDYLSRGFTAGLKNGRSINNYNGEDTLPGTFPATSSKKPGLDKDFPLLRAEEWNGGSDVVRISSPGPSPAVQSLPPVSNSSLIAGEGWTSALAEVPNVIEKTGAGSHAKVGSSATSTGLSCRSMAEALVQAPVRTGTPPQGSVKAQSLEDRAIKQSRQLIPVVPSAPKSSVLNSSDKSKNKPVVRSGEPGLASSRNTQHQSPMQLDNLQHNPGSQIKPDTNKKLVVLKPARENGVVALPAANQLTTAPSTQVAASVRSTNGPRELKGASVTMIAGKTNEKKPSLAQSQSRNAFFSALKQKTSTNISTTDPSKTNSKELVASDPSSALDAQRDVNIERVERESEVAERNDGFELTEPPAGKEAELLKILGWDENNILGYEAITEEEIKDFYDKYKDSKPSLIEKLQEATKDGR